MARSARPLQSRDHGAASPTVSHRAAHEALARQRRADRIAISGTILRMKPIRRAIIVGIIRDDLIATIGPLAHKPKRTSESKHMSLPQTDYFDANLPGASQTVRIASLHDAKVFVCRWVIRDRDPALKTLLRDMEKAKNFTMTESVIQQLTVALASRGLLVTTSR